MTSETSVNRLNQALQVSQLTGDDSRLEIFPDLVCGDSLPKWRGDELGLTIFNREEPCVTCGGRIFVLHQNTKQPGKNRVRCHNCKLEEPKRNLASTQARKAKRRALEKNAIPDNLTESDKQRIKALYAERNRLTRITGVEHHVDHIIPLSRGGLHHPDNMRVTTARLNIKKSNMLPEEWEQFLKFNKGVQDV